MGSFYTDYLDGKPCKVYYLTDNQVTLPTLKKITKSDALKLYKDANIRFSAVAYSMIKMEN